METWALSVGAAIATTSNRSARHSIFAAFLGRIECNSNFTIAIGDSPRHGVMTPSPFRILRSLTCRARALLSHSRWRSPGTG